MYFLPNKPNSSIALERDASTKQWVASVDVSAAVKRGRNVSFYYTLIGSPNKNFTTPLYLTDVSEGK